MEGKSQKVEIAPFLKWQKHIKDAPPNFFFSILFPHKRKIKKKKIVKLPK